MIQNTQSKKQYRPYLIAFASSLGIWLGQILLYPVDTISTRLKASQKQHKHILAYTRYRTLYRGVTLTFHCTFVPSLFYFIIYQQLMKKMSQIMNKYSIAKATKLIFPFFISSFSQIIALAMQLPFDVIRTRLQANEPQYNYKSIKHGFQQIYRNQGMWRLFKSGKIYFVNMTFYTGIQFQLYQMIRFYTEHNYTNMMLNTMFSTIVATTFCSPLDVVLTRYALVDTRKKQLNFKKMIKKIIKREGYKGFFKGFTAKIVAACGYSLFWFPLYEIMRQKYGIQISD